VGNRLSHVDEAGEARMVNVGEKAITRRVCVARGEVLMRPETLQEIAQGTIPKGDVLATARIAAIQAAKRTSEWIPLAHPLPLDGVLVELTPDISGSLGKISIKVTVQAQARTGVEMEALVAVSAAGLTIYDMCKAIDRDMTLDAVELVSKSGGKSGDWQRRESQKKGRAR